MFTRRGFMWVVGAIFCDTASRIMADEVSRLLHPPPNALQPVDLEGRAVSGTPSATAYVIPTPLVVRVGLRKPTIKPNVVSDELGTKLV